jgi:16S rRNA (cytidine1402-2'-O)-methyltransferase
MLAAIGEVLRPATTVCVAADLTLETETIERRPAGAWARANIARFAKRPTMFILQA